MSELPADIHETGDRPLAASATPPNSAHREGLDAGAVDRLQRDPADEDAKLDIGLDETFPTSDPPANVQPGKGLDPAPSSGFKESDTLPLDAE